MASFSRRQILVLVALGPLLATLFVTHHLGIGDSWPAWSRTCVWVLLWVGPALGVTLAARRR